MREALRKGLSRDYGVHAHGTWRGAFRRLRRTLRSAARKPLDALEAERCEDGSRRVEEKWWKRPGSKGSNVESVVGETAGEILAEQGSASFSRPGVSRLRS